MLVTPKIVIENPAGGWSTWIPIFISLASFIVAGLSAWFTYKGYLRGKPNVILKQSGKSKTAVLLEPEWDPEEKQTPDVYVDRRYRLILEVQIRNRSSNPISLSTFTLNHKFEYGQYTEPAEVYAVKTQSGTRTVKGITFGGQSKTEVFPIGKEWIRPVVHLQPFDVIQGYLFWSLYDEDLKHLSIGEGNNTLTVTTTFEDMNFEIHIDEAIKRDPYLPRRKEWTEASTLR